MGDPMDDLTARLGPICEQPDIEHLARLTAGTVPTSDPPPADLLDNGYKRGH